MGTIEEGRRGGEREGGKQRKYIAQKKKNPRSRKFTVMSFTLEAVGLFCGGSHLSLHLESWYLSRAGPGGKIC